jgi:putative phage-type endonuclease
MDAGQRLDWLRERQRGIGASDAPNLVGLGYRDALAVYRAKTAPVGHADIEPEDGPLARGIALEPVVAQRYARFMDCELVAPAAPIVRNPGAPYQLASPDRFRADNGRMVELKTTLFFDDAWGPSGTDRIPDGYMVQVQQQMGVLGRDHCDLAALDVTAWELRVYRIAFDVDVFEWLTALEAEFWREHVEKRVPPSIEWEAKYDPKKVGLLADRGTRVDLSHVPGAVELFARVKELGEIRDEAEEAYKAARDELAALMGRAERADAGPWTVKKVIVGEKLVPAKPATEATTKPGYTYLGKPTLRKDKKK